MSTEALESLRPLLGEIGGELAAGYSLESVELGWTVELTFRKGGKTFVVWLQRPEENNAFFQKTERFYVGYRGEPPDRQAFELIEALVKRIRANEGALAEDQYARLFEHVGG